MHPGWSRNEVVFVSLASWSPVTKDSWWKWPSVFVFVSGSWSAQAVLPTLHRLASLLVLHWLWTGSALSDWGGTRTACQVRIGTSFAWRFVVEKRTRVFFFWTFQIDTFALCDNWQSTVNECGLNWEQLLTVLLLQSLRLGNFCFQMCGAQPNLTLWMCQLQRQSCLWGLGTWTELPRHHVPSSSLGFSHHSVGNTGVLQSSRILLLVHCGAPRNTSYMFHYQESLQG